MSVVYSSVFSDSSYGWHGSRTGLVLYYYERQEGSKEKQEISLTSNMGKKIPETLLKSF